MEISNPILGQWAVKTKDFLLFLARTATSTQSDVAYLTLIGFKGIYIPLVAEVIVFPIIVYPLYMDRNFRTCRVHPARELLHKNGGSEPPAAWPGQSPNLPERHTLHWNLGK